MDKAPFVKEERLSGKNHPLFLSIGKHDTMQNLHGTHYKRHASRLCAVSVSLYARQSAVR